MFWAVPLCANDITLRPVAANQDARRFHLRPFVQARAHRSQRRWPLQFDHHLMFRASSVPQTASGRTIPEPSIFLSLHRLWALMYLSSECRLAKRRKGCLASLRRRLCPPRQQVRPLISWRCVQNSSCATVWPNALYSNSDTCMAYLPLFDC